MFDKPILEVQHLNIAFSKQQPVVQDLSFLVNRGEVLGLIGESGSGKSLTALTIIGLAPAHAMINGTIRYQGEKITHQHRGSKIGMIFQDPMSSLNPTMKIGKQITEGMSLPYRQAKTKAITLLQKFGLTDPYSCYKQYPHQLSGGMRQRVLLAVALANDPPLLIADEPSSALDIINQEKVMEHLKLLQSEGKSVLMISHDLHLVKKLCNRLLILRKGKLIEQGMTEEIFTSPKEEYTKILLESGIE